MSRTIILLAIFLFSIKIGYGQQSIQWLTWEEMQVLQKREPRKVLVDVYTSWCGWCKKMDKNTFQNEAIANYVNKKYYAIKFDAEYKKKIAFNGAEYNYVSAGKRGHHELAAAILKGRLSFPTIVFLDESMKVIQPIPGYQDPKSMELILTYFAGEYYKDILWRKYTSMYNNNLIQDAGFKE